MLRILLVSLAFALTESNLFATTGWDRHEVTIHGKYRIHGKNGGSFVHIIGSDGKLIGPPLCSNLANEQSPNYLGCPPEYAVSKTHLHIRYPQTSLEEVENYYSIELETSAVYGPITARAFESRYEDLSWKTPWTAADKFGLYVWGFLSVLGVVVLCVVYVLYRMVRMFVAWSHRRPSKLTKPAIDA